jgi:hypothetical protein
LSQGGSAALTGALRLFASATHDAGNRVRTRLPAGGKEIRTVGPAVKEKPFRRPKWLLFARTYRTSGLADETGTSGIKNLRCSDVGPRVRIAPSSAASYKPDQP